MAAKSLNEFGSLPGRTRRLLLVGDHRELSGLLVDAPRRARYAVTAADSADDAIAAIATAAPDLALLDIKMTCTSGLTLFELLRDQFGIPFVFYSARDSEETVHRAMLMGALACVVKPFEMCQCIPAINTAVARADELRRLRLSESQLADALQQTRAISMAIGLVMQRLRLSREMALEILRREARAKRRRMNQVAEDLLKSVERVRSITTPASQPAREAAARKSPQRRVAAAPTLDLSGEAT